MCELRFTILGLACWGCWELPHFLLLQAVTEMITYPGGLEQQLLWILSITNCSGVGNGEHTTVRCFSLILLERKWKCNCNRNQYVLALC